MHHIEKKEFLTALGMGLLHSMFGLFVILSSIWLCLALWFQAPISGFITRALIGIWISFTLTILGIYITQYLLNRQTSAIIYILAFLLGLFWYLSLEAKQDRDWNPEVAQVLSFKQAGNLVTLHNVRNFNWHTDGSYDQRWETRQFDLNQITGVNIITSYWMGPRIAHTLVSFDFSNGQPLTFSIEIRKQKNEEFSTYGGFFRKYELSLVASDEKDLIYTRSNIRKEQVYFFPVDLSKAESRALFEEYLHKANELKAQPKWYNTLTSNCTTLVFDMVQAVSKRHLPTDYRLLASGYLPNYLYDLKAISHNLSMQQWYDIAHINPRVSHLNHLSSAEYSSLIRQGIPKPIPEPSAH
ncbi:Lnb N-terminal periplasmic domain-containing protein [Acinetobacter bouvetii]|uniref:Lnb N-terminal periplasmic domain-containing protein n=1 Tax=Acinetobacter bouvetii TaxID=202951 RepID=A0A811G851_9GAMM|nr:DUF4105 domain-containing protein [Acinetobacter bouvetii]CAB1208503.1 hypothetical protein SFB21_0446 [Acinetobacter bouvetii]